MPRITTISILTWAGVEGFAAKAAGWFLPLSQKAIL